MTVSPSAGLTVTPTVTPSQTTALVGDLDNDGRITANDYNILLSCSIYSSDNGQACGGRKAAADLNHDGVINILDLNIVQRSL